MDINEMSGEPIVCGPPKLDREEKRDDLLGFDEAKYRDMSNWPPLPKHFSEDSRIFGRWALSILAADAENFTADEVAKFSAWGHDMIKNPRRRAVCEDFGVEGWEGLA